MAKKGILKSLEKKENKQTNSEPLQTITRFYVGIPFWSVHINYPVRESATIGQYIDKHVVDKIYELLKCNITNVAEVKLKSLGVSQMLRSQRRQIGDIIHCTDLRNHIAWAISAQKYFDDDQESLCHKSSDWQERSPKTKFFYRTSDNPPDAADPTKRDSPERTPSSSYIKSHGNRDCYSDT